MENFTNHRPKQTPYLSVGNDCIFKELKKQISHIAYEAEMRGRIHEISGGLFFSEFVLNPTYRYHLGRGEDRVLVIYDRYESYFEIVGLGSDDMKLLYDWYNNKLLKHYDPDSADSV